VRVPLPSLIAAVLIAVGLGACSDDEPATSTTTLDVTTTTGSATTTSGASTTAPAPEPLAEIVLRGDGLGVVELGADPDVAVAAVTDALGEPTADTGWESSFSEYGTCPGEEVRGVEWNHLILLFTDGSTAYGNGPHLFTWRVTGAPPALGTATGFGYRATAADAEDLYPGDVEVVPPDEPFPGLLRIDAEGGTITAYLDDADVVTNIEAGAACGE
jgi:hypothetical protein